MGRRGRRIGGRSASVAVWAVVSATGAAAGAQLIFCDRDGEGLIVGQIRFAWAVREACRELSFLAVDLSRFLESAPTHIHIHMYTYLVSMSKSRLLKLKRYLFFLSSFTCEKESFNSVFLIIYVEGLYCLFTK